MRRVSAVVVMSALVLTTVSPAWAQQDDKKPVEVLVTFPEHDITGDPLSPSDKVWMARNPAKFKRMAKLKRSFVKRIFDTRAERALR